MAIIQPQSPHAQRALLNRGSDGMVYQERGAISRAAPSVQAVLLHEQKEARKRFIMKCFYVGSAALIVIAVAMFFLNQTATASKQVMTGAKKPAKKDQISLMVVEAPTTTDVRHTLDYASTAQEFINKAKVNGVRLLGSNSKAIINGEMFRVGDVVAPEMGLVFVGHDPDGEYLLFRDSKLKTVFLRVHDNTYAERS